MTKCGVHKFSKYFLRFSTPHCHQTSLAAVKNVFPHPDFNIETTEISSEWHNCNTDIVWTKLLLGLNSDLNNGTYKAGLAVRV
jgi:hypothetical protein